MVCPLMTIMKIPKLWSTAIQQGSKWKPSSIWRDEAWTWKLFLQAIFHKLSDVFPLPVFGQCNRNLGKNPLKLSCRTVICNDSYRVQIPAAETHPHWLIHPHVALGTSHRTTSPTLQFENTPWSLQDSNPKTFHMQSINPVGLVPLTEIWSHGPFV